MKLNRLVLFGMILALFFEANPFSVRIFGVRIRAVQVLACAGAFVVLAGVLAKRWPLQKTRLGPFLWGYLGVNALAILNSQDPRRGIKITILLFSLILIFFVMVYLLLKKEIFVRAFHLFLWAGMAEMAYGLYQVGAGLINLIFKAHLPIGASGLAQVQYIGAPWGRPYGTFAEADWFAAVALFYALLFLALSFSSRPNRRFYRAGLVLSLAVLFLGFVRGAWGGFLFGLILFIVFGKRIRGLKFKPAMIIKPVAILVLAVAILIFVFSPIRQVFQKRFFPAPGQERYYTMDIRWVAVKESVRSFLESPLIGRGPGTVGRSMSFNPSLVTTLLEDTGVLGLIFFGLFLFSFFRMGVKRIPELNEHDQPASFGLFLATAGLFASYLITCGLWMPFTWAFLGFSVASLRNAAPSRAS